MSRTQLAFLAIVPKATGGISLITSSSVIIDVLKDAKKRQTTYHRLVVGISVSDVLVSQSFFFGTWAMPVGSSWGAIGNVFTCDVIGFLAQGGMVCAFLYNVVLSTYYLLMLKYRWDTTKLKSTEPWLHAFALITGWSIALIGLMNSIYGGAVYFCWIGPYPGDCNSPETCIRGYNYEFYRWGSYILVWTSLAYMSITMFVVYIAVRRSELSSKLSDYIDEETEEDAQKQNRDTDENAREVTNTNEEVKTEEKIDLSQFSLPIPPRPRLTSIQTESQRRKDYQLRLKNKSAKSRRIMIQAFLYVAAVFITYTFASITRFVLHFSAEMTRTEAVTKYFSLLLLTSIFGPLQGLFNCLIYFRYKIAKKIRNCRKAPKEPSECEIDETAQDFNLQDWLASRNNGSAIRIPNDQQDGGGRSQSNSLRDSARMESMDNTAGHDRIDEYDQDDAENDYF